jgi:hypothetical protein
LEGGREGGREGERERKKERKEKKEKNEKKERLNTCAVTALKPIHLDTICHPRHDRAECHDARIVSTPKLITT